MEEKPVPIKEIEEEAVSSKVAVKPSTTPSAVPQDGMLTHEAFAMAVQEIKKTIEAEFSALRTELKLWRDER